jgi:LytS/YehU family sensor histidine kinase
MKAQLQPHFLFNTLHTISAMIREDVAGAERMIARLSDLLRLLLAHMGTHEVPLHVELDFVRNYFEIQRIRYGGQLDLRASVAPNTLDASVPNMILQPLVENAIKHGFDPRSVRPLHVSICARREGARLLITVSDDGRGLAPRANRDEGVGLKNVRSRLYELYGCDARLELSDAEGAGCLARIDLPDREGPVTSPAALEAYDHTNDHRRRRDLGAQTAARVARGRA